MRVQCIEDKGTSRLTAGREYTAHPHPTDADCYTITPDDSGADGGWHMRRFIPALSSQPEAPTAPDMILPTDAAARKGMPITTGVLDYFPLAIAEVAMCSKAGNDQHNPGQPLHWAKDKSTDHADCIPRHLIDRYSRDTDGVRHAAKMAWRSLAFLQTLLEKEREANAVTA